MKYKKKEIYMLLNMQYVFADRNKNEYEKAKKI